MIEIVATHSLSETELHNPSYLEVNVSEHIRI